MVFHYYFLLKQLSVYAHKSIRYYPITHFLVQCAMVTPQYAL